MRPQCDHGGKYIVIYLYPKDENQDCDINLCWNNNKMLEAKAIFKFSLESTYLNIQDFFSFVSTAFSMLSLVTTGVDKALFSYNTSRQRKTVNTYLYKLI